MSSGDLRKLNDTQMKEQATRILELIKEGSTITASTMIKNLAVELDIAGWGERLKTIMKRHGFDFRELVYERD